MLKSYLSVSVLKMPRFDCTQKVHHLDLISKVFVSRQVGVTSVRVHVVREGDVLADVSVGPATEVGVEESLVASIKRALLARPTNQSLVSV